MIGAGVGRQESFKMLAMKLKFVIRFCKSAALIYTIAITFDLNKFLGVLKVAVEVMLILSELFMKIDSLA